MNKKYNKSYLLIDIVLMVLVGLGLYLGVVIPNSYYTFAVNIIAFLVSIILTALILLFRLKQRLYSTNNLLVI